MADEVKLAVPIVFFGNDPRHAANQPQATGLKDFRPRVMPADAPEPSRVITEQATDEVPKDSSATNPASDSTDDFQTSPSETPAATVPAEKDQSNATVRPLVIGS